MKSLRTNEKLAVHVRPGKQSIKGEHRGLFIEATDATVAHSVDFESLAEGVQPNASRADYLISTARSSDWAHAVEVHAFRPRELLAKKHGTVSILRELCPETVGEIASWQLVLVGNAPRQDIVARFQAESGIRVAGRVLRITSLR